MPENTTNREGLRRRPVFITACVAGLAAALGGCSTSGGHSYNGSYNNGSLASQSGAELNPVNDAGKYDAQYFAQRAGEANAPAVWASEAQLSIHELEARRAELQAERVRIQARQAEMMAYAEADTERAQAREAAMLAGADEIRNVSDARQLEYTVRAATQRLSIEREATYGKAEVGSHQKSRHAEMETFRSEASRSYEIAKAELKRMKQDRELLETEGNAEIEKMRRIASMTDSRAKARIQALRAEGASAKQENEARLAELNVQLVTVTERADIRAEQLRTQAQSVQSQSISDARDLVSRAEQLEKTQLSTGYEFEVQKAESAFNTAMADARRLQNEAETMLTNAEAEISRLRGDAERFLGENESGYNESSSDIEAARASDMAFVEVYRAKANAFETQARARFVDAEAQATFAAAVEQAQHLNDTAEKRYELAKAEAEAEAARIRSEVMTTIAGQIASGSVQLPGKLNPENPFDSMTVPVGENVEVSEIPPVVEPEHVANFRAALAKVAVLRARANADESVVESRFENDSKRLDAWWSGVQAEFEAMHAEADGLENRALAESTNMIERADARKTAAQAGFDHARAEAEANRKSTLAQITAFRAEAQAVVERSHAAVTQLLAEAEAVDSSGSADRYALTEQIEAEQARGEARVSELFAEADSVYKSNEALKAQMYQEIISAEQTLAAELNRLDNNSLAFIRTAEADFREAEAFATAYEVQTQAMTNRMLAQQDSLRVQANAEVTHMQNLAQAEELAYQGRYELAVAEANFTGDIAAAKDAVRRAEAIRDTMVGLASVDSELAGVDAMDEPTRALFEARLVGVQSDRDRAYAENYMSERQRQMRIAQAQAASNAYREISQAALARLSGARRAFEDAAGDNWDARLAIPGALTRQELDGSNWLMENGEFGLDIAGVPTDQD